MGQQRGIGSRRHRSERGSGSLEFVGITITAAILVAASVGAVTAADPHIRDTIWAQICKITGGECEAGEMPSNRAFKPEECELYSGQNSFNTTVDIAFIRLGGGQTVQRVEKSNGDIEITLLHEGRGGVTAGVGAKGRLDIGETKVGAGAELEAAVTGGYSSGDTYLFTDEEQADAFQGHLQGEMTEDAALPWLPGANVVNGIYEWATDEQPPTNAGVQKTYVRYDVTEEAHASATAGYGASAEVNGSYMVAMGTEFDRGADPESSTDDTQTDFYQVDWSAGFEVGLPAVKGVSGSYSPSGVVKVKRDVEGNPVQVQIIDKAQGSFEFGLNANQNSTSGIDPAAPGGALDGWGVKLTGGPNTSTVVTQTLDLDSPESQEAFNNWFTWYDTGLDTALKASAPNWAVDTTKGEAVDGSGSSAEDFTALMSQQSQTSIVEYDGSTWGLGGALEVALGFKAGLDVGYDDEESSSVKAAYLGAPLEDGSRPSYEMPECVS